MAFETVIGATDLKARCLGLIDDVAQGRTDRIVLRKCDRAVAPETNLTAGTGEVWDANR
jgi:hypothetical protein